MTRGFAEVSFPRHPPLLLLFTLVTQAQLRTREHYVNSVAERGRVVLSHVLGDEENPLETLLGAPKIRHWEEMGKSLGMVGRWSREVQFNMVASCDSNLFMNQKRILLAFVHDRTIRYNVRATKPEKYKIVKVGCCCYINHVDSANLLEEQIPPSVEDSSYIYAREKYKMCIQQLRQGYPLPQHNMTWTTVLALGSSILKQNASTPATMLMLGGKYQESQVQAFVSSVSQCLQMAFKDKDSFHVNVRAPPEDVKSIEAMMMFLNMKPSHVLILEGLERMKSLKFITPLIALSNHEDTVHPQSAVLMSTTYEDLDVNVTASRASFQVYSQQVAFKYLHSLWDGESDEASMHGGSQRDLCPSLMNATDQDHVHVGRKQRKPRLVVLSNQSDTLYPQSAILLGTTYEDLDINVHATRASFQVYTRKVASKYLHSLWDGVKKSSASIDDQLAKHLEFLDFIVTSKTIAVRQCCMNVSAFPKHLKIEACYYSM
ncbi:unnamed protein product [Darwinula stevensoni]|uniref:Uncharacterized protein n=1 Tax=Darwinula stevensoni TaxID=69355 RepID=A0A7R9ADT6_9CRUS|nr:unnamed protein product [Darwinula stevensoni]CAG0901026.1 unnamed protein product [Darwinula stevensoni]